MKLKHLELALATIALLISCYGLLGEADSAWRGYLKPSDYYNESFARNGLRYSFTLNYLAPKFLLSLARYGAFLWMAIGLPNAFAQKRKWRETLLAMLAGWLIAWLVSGLTVYLGRPFANSYLVHGIYRQMGQTSILFFCLTVYLVLKHTGIWLWERRAEEDKRSTNRKMLIDVFVLTAVWLVLMGIVVVAGVKVYIFFFVALIVSCFFITCLLNLHWLMPVYLTQVDKSRFWLMQFGVTFLLNIPLTGIYMLMGTHSPYMLVVMFMVFWPGQLCLAIPLSYWVYRIRTDNAAEINTLKTDLNTSAATLQFLRGQINPHFLFNALNSLYGMALIENAEKTGEGIQLLGDMMRFMLHENNQEQIGLGSEIGYLQNYITLQNMRIAASPDIKITVEISEQNTQYHIAPMLLVPFVENAYKHGISFKEPSWINVSLSVLNGQLQFDVRNSIHPERESDPERHSSGIGLENVKQRLALLYPERHSLVVRKTTTEYFIYLNLQLK